MVIIENNKVKELETIIKKSDKQLVDILRKILNIQVDKIIIEKRLKLKNISEYEFEVIKTKAKLENDNEVEIYFKPIKNSRIKESIFCYWCLIYEEEISKINSSFENNDQTISNDSVDNMNKEDEISIINALEELSDISDEYVSVVDKLKENPNDYDAIEEYLSVIIKLAKLVEKYENEDYVEMQNDFTDEEKAYYMNLYKEIDDKMTKANEELEKLDITLFD